MTGALLLQIMAALGGLAGFSAIINLLISRKKIAAESEDIIQNTTDKVIKNLTDDNDTLRADVKTARAEVAEIRTQNNQLYDIVANLERNEMEYRRFIHRVVNWSRLAYEKIIEANINIDQPPSMDQLQQLNNKKSQSE